MRHFLSKIYASYDLNANDRMVYFMGMRFRLRKSKQKRQQSLSSKEMDVSAPIQKKKILFRSHAEGFSGNPKYIALEIIRRKLPYDLVWIIDKEEFRHISEFPPEIRLEIAGSEKSFQDAVSAGIWIDDSNRRYLLDRGIRKREGQIYFQTWRGSFGIKKFGSERHNMNEKTASRAMEDLAQVDFFISHSEWESAFYKRVFQADERQVLLMGHARNDILLSNDSKCIRADVFSKLGLSSEKKLLFYAPTLSENRGRSAFDLNYDKLKSALERSMGGEWVIAARMHMQGRRRNYLPHKDYLIDVSHYGDNQELLVAADALISDYSSCIFDFLLTGKPAFLYVADRSSYEWSRGLYYPLEEAPCPLAETSTQLCSHIEHYESALYRNKIEKFLEEKGNIEDGRAASRIVDFIEKLISDSY